MRNIGGPPLKPLHRLKIVPRVREIEAFIDQREIRNDVPQDRKLDGRPVHERWVANLAPVDRTVLSGHDEIEDLPAPAFHGGERPLSSNGHAIGLRRNGSSWDSCTDLPDEPDRLVDLVHANTHPGSYIAIAVEGYLDLKLVVSREGAVTAHVPIDIRP